MDSGNPLGSGSGGIAKTCQEAQDNHASVGCDYYAIDMDAAQGPPQDACYAVFIANTSDTAVHINTTWMSMNIDMSKYAKLPQGQGQSLTYGNYDVNAGLAPGQVAILFLAYQFQLGNVACPVPAAIGHGPQLSGTGKNWAFHITTDSPVVAYQMLPYGGGSAAATGASLLLPTTAWDTSYIAASAYDTAAPPIPVAQGPSHDVVAMEDNTTVTMYPKGNIDGGGGLGTGPANQPYKVVLKAGEYFQITQGTPLSGSPVTADKPVGTFGGHQIMSIDRCCGDHGEQMLAPVRALGYQYVGAPHPDRKPAGMPDPRVYRLYGAVSGTQLTYEPPGLGPATLNVGDQVEIRTDGAFVVTSQDSNHPFQIFTYMTGAGEMGEGGWGDPDFVRLPPPAQYMSHYVFFTDVTYPFTGLTVVRQANQGAFADVMLDCMGAISGWQPVGTSGQYEIATVKLVDHWNGQGGCNNGVHNMTSTVPFGTWVWGWGSEDTNTGWVSYGYPAGENVLPINDVIIQ
jgi:hypothetical protein